MSGNACLFSDSGRIKRLFTPLPHHTVSPKSPAGPCPPPRCNMKKAQQTWKFFLLYLLFWLAEDALAPYLGLFYQSRGMDGIQVGLLNNIFSVTVIVSSIVIGMAGDRYGNSRRLLTILSIGLIAATGTLALGRSFAALAACTAAYGLFYSPFNGIVDQMLMLKISDRPNTYGRYRLGGTVGAGIGVIIAGIILSRNGTTTGLFATYWIAMVLTLPVIFSLPRTVASNADGRASLLDFRQILLNRHFFPVYGILLVWGFTESSMMQFQAIHIVNEGFSKSLTSVFIALSMVGEATSFALMPRITTRLGRQRTLGLAFLLQFFKIAALTLIRTLPLPLVGLFQLVGGAAYAPVYSIATELVSRTFPEKLGYSAQTLKLVVNRGMGVSLGTLSMGTALKLGHLKGMYAFLAAVALLYATFVLATRCYRFANHSDGQQTIQNLQ